MCYFSEESWREQCLHKRLWYKKDATGLPLLPTKLKGNNPEASTGLDKPSRSICLNNIQNGTDQSFSAGQQGKKVMIPFQEYQQQLCISHQWHIRPLNLKGSINCRPLPCIINNLEVINLLNCKCSLVSEDRLWLLIFDKHRLVHYYVLESNGSVENWWATLKPSLALPFLPSNLMSYLPALILEQHPCIDLVQDQYSSIHSQKYSCFLPDPSP